jgi:hypothetical protein
LAAPAAAQTPGVAQNVERTIYLQKPAQPVTQAQAIAPPAPPQLMVPLSTPSLMPLEPLRPTMPTPPVATTPGMQFVGQAPVAANGIPNGAVATQSPPTTVNLDTPKRDDVFRFDDDDALKQRIRREIAASKNKLEVKLPDTVASPAGPHVPRSMAPMQVLIEPSYVVHRRMFFEHKNTERAGWDFGLAQPVVSTLHFYQDCLFWPHMVASNFLEPYETSAGKTVPGCATPLLLYPPETTLFGGTAGAALIVGAAVALP